MVNLCVSISNDGLRLESVHKRSPNSARNRRKKSFDMATMQRQPKLRTTSTRQARGSCSSTASCPIFSGPYSDQEEDPPLRRQSSPLLKGSLSRLHNATSSSCKSFLSNLQGSVPSLQGSLPSLPNAVHIFQDSLPNLRGAFSRLKRRSLGGMDNSIVNLNNRSTSPRLQSGNRSSSDDDGSWDTNSWSSGATCLLRTPVKQDSTETPVETDVKSSNQPSTTSKAEPEIIYQNLLYSQPIPKSNVKVGSTKGGTQIVPKKETQSVASSCKKSTSQYQDEKTADREKFSQFLNDVTYRVLKTNGSTSQQVATLQHRFPSSPLPPPSVPSHKAANTLRSSNPLAAPPANTCIWYSPTSSNLQAIKEYHSKDITASIHQWSKTLPSCKILEPGDTLQKVIGESPSHTVLDLELCTKIQAQPSTGRLYLETDIDRVRRLDELVANGTLEKECNDKGLDKAIEKLKVNTILWEKNGNAAVDKEKENERRKICAWEERTVVKGKERDKTREGPCWEKDRQMEQMERLRDKERKAVPDSYESLCSKMVISEWSNPVFGRPDGIPRMSYRSTSLPRHANITVSIPVH